MSRIDELIIQISTFSERNGRVANVVLISEDVKEELKRAINKPWLPFIEDCNTACGIPICIVEGVNIMRVGWFE